MPASCPFQGLTRLPGHSPSLTCSSYQLQPGNSAGHSTFRTHLFSLHQLTWNPPNSFPKQTPTQPSLHPCVREGSSVPMHAPHSSSPGLLHPYTHPHTVGASLSPGYGDTSIFCDGMPGLYPAVFWTESPPSTLHSNPFLVISGLTAILPHSQ